MGFAIADWMVVAVSVPVVSDGVVTCDCGGTTEPMSDSIFRRTARTRRFADLVVAGERHPPVQIDRRCHCQQQDDAQSQRKRISRSVKPFVRCRIRGLPSWFFDFDAGQFDCGVCWSCCRLLEARVPARSAISAVFARHEGARIRTRRSIENELLIDGPPS